MLANSYLEIFVKIQKAGAPIECVAGRNPIPASTHLLGIYAHARHPNAAKLFVDFVLSREGMLLLRSFKRIPSRLDVEPMVARLTKGIKFYPSEPELAEEFDKYARTFQNLFEIR